MRLIAGTVGLLFVGLAVAGSASAGSYTFTTIDPPGSSYTQLTGINRHHEVSGWSKDSSLSNAKAQAFVWRDGRFTVVPPRNANVGRALYALNEAGDAVGRENPERAGGDAILYRTAQNRTLLPVSHATGLTNSFLYDINNHGVSVGTASSKGQYEPPDTAIVVDGGALVRVAGLSGLNSRLLGINDAGQGFGAFYDAMFAEGWFTYAAGQATLVTFPTDTDNPSVTSISEDGRLTGSFRAQGGDGVVGFVRVADHFQRVRYPGGLSTVVSAANGAGVFGTYYDATLSVQRVFVRAHGVYRTLTPPTLPSVSLRSVSADGSFIGTYLEGRISHGYVAICPPDQQPCT